MPNKDNSFAVLTQSTTQPEQILIKFTHGLGDAVQLTIVLKHLMRYRPEWRVDVAATTGKQSAFHGLCRRAYIMGREEPDYNRYDRVLTLRWAECSGTAYEHYPNTKATVCLDSELGLVPDLSLFKYAIHVNTRARGLADAYLSSLCSHRRGTYQKYPVVLIHYEGATSREKKNLPHEIVRQVCDCIIAHRHVPIILDWDRGSPLIDDVRVHNPDSSNPLWEGMGVGDVQTIAALIDASSLMIGIDSGPLHVAGAMTTPTLGV
jgi:ADP-heptose:LPS heptosyltransferase